MNIVLGCDHAGFIFATKLGDYLKNVKYNVVHVGATSTEPYDYPDASDAVSAVILAEEASLGVLVCGTGIGVAMRANRHSHIRAAQCFTVEMAELARRHNHANVLCLGGRIQDYGDCVEILHAFIQTPEDHSPRHEQRVCKLDSPLATP